MSRILSSFPEPSSSAESVLEAEPPVRLSQVGDFIGLIADQTAVTPAEFCREVNSRRDSVSRKLLDERR